MTPSRFSLESGEQDVAPGQESGTRSPRLRVLHKAFPCAPNQLPAPLVFPCALRGEGSFLPLTSESRFL